MTAGSGVARADGGMLALVHTQAAGDNGPVDSMIARLQDLAEETGMTARAIYAQDPATYETIFRTLGDAGASVIVTTFAEVGAPVKALAPQYPGTKWIQLYADPIEPALPNVATISYDYHLGCYLSGVFGALMSETGKIGYVGGASLPTLNADLNAMKAGALSVNPDIKVLSAFAGSFQDPAKGQEIATQMYTEGADFIQTDAAATDGGIIAAANEADGRMVSAISPAQYRLGPATVATLVSLDFGQSLYNEVSRAMADGWTGGHVSTGLGTGVIDFIASPVFAEEGPEAQVSRIEEIWPEVEAIKQQIMEGTVEVPFDTTL
ncbi:BMP family ABC transporter substrate-binding protein [Pseudooceanicola antarcticus]|nr:BMP family ABC transporter substrate-binding protein [Pseudooceanicola antarcticus]PJE31111.1 BMP family ABC transporter substrate-binding protein [Pseudooceanicola antarcticus]